MTSRCAPRLEDRFDSPVGLLDDLAGRRSRLSTMVTFVKTRMRILAASIAALAVSGCNAPTTPTAQVTAHPSGSPTCPPGLVPVDLTVPTPDETRLNVLNASDAKGAELTVFVELGQRGFQMLSTTDRYGDGRPYPEAAVIRYGPQTVGAGWLVSSYIDGQVRTEFDIHRSDDRVDVILGSAFENIRTPAEVKEAVAAAGQPVPPPGTCPVPR